LSFPSPFAGLFLWPFARTSLAQEIVAGENKMFARADSRNSLGVSYCVATFSADASRSLNSGAQKRKLGLPALASNSLPLPWFRRSQENESATSQAALAASGTEPGWIDRPHQTVAQSANL